MSEKMNHRIITISREFGSGGRTIGREVAKKLGIPCYDSELIDEIAERSGFAKEYIETQGEYAKHGSRVLNALDANRAFSTYSIQDNLWMAQRRVILELAEKESCVIIGRCSDYILREQQNCLKVFIHAAMDKRAERIVKVYGETDTLPEKRLKDKDKRRKAYYDLYTDMKWGRIQNYHVTLDSGTLGLEKCTEIIVSLY